MALKRVNKLQKEKVNPMQVLKQKRDYADKIQEELELKGVDFFNPSEEGSLNIDTNYLTLPPHITEVSATDLGEYLNAFTQQKMYMRTLLGWAELYLEEAKREYFQESQSLYGKLSETKMSEKAKERELNSDPTIFPYYEKYMDKQKSCMLLEFNISSIEEAIFMISREVSRRSGDFNNENRNYNVSRS